MTSRLAQMQARFQQKQMEEKEQKLLKLYENQQQRTIDRVGRNSAGSNTSNASTTSLGSTGGGKVRAMFDERRQKAGIDKSHPLKPLERQSNGRSISLGRQTNGVSKTTTIKTSTTRESISSVIQSENPKILESENINVNHEGRNNNNNKKNLGKKTNFNNLKHKNSTTSLLGMLNNHNSGDILDNQYLQDKVDSQENALGQPLYVSEKLSNVGGKLPSQVQKETDNKDYNHCLTFGSPDNGDKNHITKTHTSRGANKSKSPSKPIPSIGFVNGSAAGSPIKPNNMSNKPSGTQRAPLNNRPSAKQTAKSGVVRDDLADCRFCGRRFATDRLGKHEDICGKTAKKKRKAYDSTKHRVQGTELEGYVMKGGKKGAGASKAPPKLSSTGSKTNWRKTHEEFLAAIRAAKQAQDYVAKGGKLTDLPPPPPSSNPDYVQCPHCGRRFNAAAAERHIPKCATYQYNKPKPGQKR